MDLWLQEGRLGMGIARDGHVPLLYFKWINKALLYSTGNSAQLLRGSLEGRGVWKRRDTRMYMAESLCCPPETITTLLMGYIQYKIKSLKKRKKAIRFSGIQPFSLICSLFSDKTSSERL